MKSNYYMEVFGLLWTVNKFLTHQMDQHSYLHTNMVLLSLQLDALFHDVIGLITAQNLPIVNLPARPKVNSTCVSSNYNSPNSIYIDILPLWFSKPFLFSTSTYFEDLCDLLNDIAHNVGKASFSPRKLKPSSVSSGLRQRSSSHISLSSDSHPWSSNRLGANEKEGIKEKLIDAFFHQHKDLQQLCEMAVDRVIKNFSETVSKTCITPTFRNGATAYEEYFNDSSRINLNEYNKILQTLEIDASLASRSLMNDDFDRIITGTLRLLASPSTNPKVLEIASTLAISHAVKRGECVFNSLVCEETKKMMDDFIRKERKANAGVPLTSSKASRGLHSNSVAHSANLLCFLELNSLLMEFSEQSCLDENAFQVLKETKGAAYSQLQSSKESICYLSVETASIVEDFGSLIVSFFEKFFSSPSDKTASMVKAAVEVSDILSFLGKRGCLESIRNDVVLLFCNSENLLALMIRAKSVETSSSSPDDSCLNCPSPEAIGAFLFMLVDSTLISNHSLEKALMQSISKDERAKNVIECVMNKVAFQSGMNEWIEGHLIMTRLQNMMLRS